MTLGAIAALTGYRGVWVAASLSAFAGLFVLALAPRPRPAVSTVVRDEHASG